MVGYRVAKVALKSSYIDQYRDTLELALAISYCYNYYYKLK